MRAAFAACGGDLVEAVADLELHLPNELLARGHEARGNPVFRYRFTWEAPVRRACHALDLPFTFGTLDVSTWREFAGADGARAGAADALSARMQQAWASFVADGVPCDDRRRPVAGRTAGRARARGAASVTTTSPPGCRSGWARPA